MLAEVRERLEASEVVARVQRVVYPFAEELEGLLVTSAAGSRFLLNLADADELEARYAASGLDIERAYRVVDDGA